MSGTKDKDIAFGETVAPAPSAPAVSGDAATIASGVAATVASGVAATVAAGDVAPPPPGEERSRPSTRDDIVRGTTIGQHYVIESVLGRGGMGTVYLARDATLGRDVALKLHRHATNDDRLYREAVAMAQLAHPNVVTVFEVGEHAGRLFVAMEYVRGATLRDWLAERSRTWQEVLAMLVVVGEGLAEAHRAGLVHRDFKPENVLVGQDGRPRVSDFGLARTAPTAGVPGGASASAFATPPARTPLPTSGAMTVAGALLGTPGYMPPEQVAGGEVDARGDQFAYCVAAWECLYGRRPFDGATLPALQQAIERRQLVEPPARPVPPSVRDALVRGLSPTPAERWPDMTALLAVLRAATRRRTRWPIAAAAAGIVAAGAVAVVAWPRPREVVASCTTAGAEIGTLVPAPLRTAVIARAAAAGSGAGNRAERNLEHVVAVYRDTAKVACRASSRRDWSRDVAERSAACLEEQAQIIAVMLQTALDQFHDPRRAIVMSSEVLSHADIGMCIDPDALLAEPSWPRAQRSAIARARAELHAADFLADAGLMAPAKAIVERIAAGPVAGAPGIAAALALARADLLGANHDPGAVRAMSDAYYRAHADGDQLTEIAALEYLLLWVGSEREDATGVEPWYRLALSELPRFQRISPLQAGQLRSALVGVAVARNELKVAVEQARLATEALAHGPPLARATALHEYANALATAGDTARSIDVYEQAAKQVEDALGPNDPNVALVLTDLSLTLGDAKRTQEAIAVGEHALAIVQRDPDDDSLAAVELNLAAVLSNARQDERAEQLLIDARARWVKLYGEDSAMIATIDSDLGELDVDRGKYAVAIPKLRSALAMEEKLVGPDHPDVATSLTNLVDALDHANDHAGAIAAARRCVAIRQKSLPRTDQHALALAQLAQVENNAGRAADALRDAQAASDLGAPHTNPVALAWPELERARALLALHRDPAQATRLLESARTIYVGQHDTDRLREITALMMTAAPQRSSRAPRRQPE